jgi:hypothetical protein
MQLTHCRIAERTMKKEFAALGSGLMHHRMPLDMFISREKVALKG